MQTSILSFFLNCIWIEKCYIFIYRYFLVFPLTLESILCTFNRNSLEKVKTRNWGTGAAQSVKHFQLLVSAQVWSQGPGIELGSVLQVESAYVSFFLSLWASRPFSSLSQINTVNLKKKKTVNLKKKREETLKLGLLKLN